jgi:TolB-like protein
MYKRKPIWPTFFLLLALPLVSISLPTGFQSLVIAADMYTIAAHDNDSTSALTAKNSLAVLPLNNQEGVSTGEAEIITDCLRSEFFNTGKIITIERASIDKILTTSIPAQSRAFDDSASLIMIGKLLNANLIVSGSIGKIGTSIIVNLRVFDVQSAQVVQTTSRSIYNMNDVVPNLPELCRDLIDNNNHNSQHLQRYDTPSKTAGTPAWQRNDSNKSDGPETKTELSACMGYGFQNGYDLGVGGRLLHPTNDVFFIGLTFLNYLGKDYKGTSYFSYGGHYYTHHESIQLNTFTLGADFGFSVYAAPYFAVRPYIEGGAAVFHAHVSDDTTSYSSYSSRFYYAPGFNLQFYIGSAVTIGVDLRYTVINDIKDCDAFGLFWTLGFLF